jgi:serine/threonine protein kinase/tetratricopeptide (TPR) repeat protein
VSELRDEGGDDTQDGELLADLFDTLLQEILDGRTPDLASYFPDRPDLRERVAKTWALACSVAGRREPSRPVLGGYEILRELGHGGMGTVYLARHQALQREVAIKVLPHSLALSPRAKQRFLEEARALARVRHDSVVHIHRIIDHAEMLAFEMEFIDGPSLRTLVLALAQKAKPQSIQSLAEVLQVPADSLGTSSTVEWFVRLGIKIARALGEVHRHGLVHRDVKPSNILLRGNGHPILADFGLALDGDLHATHAAFAGTPVYAAPERLRSGDADVDARADVYSLAVSLYEALTLGPSFGGSTTHEVLRHIEEGNLPSLRKRAPNVSRDLETVVAKAMEPDRRHRYATADEFADDLERLLSLQPIHAQPAGPLRRALKFVRRHDKIAMAAVGGAVLVAAITWPVVAHARAADEAKARATAAVREARSHLLCPENLDSSWTAARSPGHQQVLRTPTARAAQLAQLDTALAAYDTALAAAPAERIQIERDVVGLVRTLVARDGLDEAPATPAEIERLPELTRRLAHRAIEDSGADVVEGRDIPAANPTDRFAAGLFAFLRSDLRNSRLFWRDLATNDGDQVFLDACLALQMADEGQPERAYPRLFQAARDFPTATAIGFAIADAAIANGDTGLAKNWLAQAQAANNGNVTHTRRLRLQADMLAAEGDVDQARRLYRELTRLDPSSPEPLQRLASLALVEGDHVTALRIYQDLARRWPDLAVARHHLARLALQRHDLHGYLTLAREALATDLSRTSTGTAMQLAGILRLGGLQSLYAEKVALLHLEPHAMRDADVHPLSTWVPPSRLRGIEQALRFFASFDAASDVSNSTDLRPVAVTLRSIQSALARCPNLTFSLPLSCQALALAGIPVMLEPVTRIVSPLLLPYQRILGDRVHMFPNAPVFLKPLAHLNEFYALQILRVTDSNGDTLPELCVTAPPRGTNSGTGYLELRNLGDGALLDTWHSEDEESLFARSVAVLGDVDGDLCCDLAVGVPINRSWSLSLPTVTLRSGRTGQTIWTIEEESPSFGAELASIGDIDGDGVHDLIAGVPPMTLAADVRGEALVVSGKTGRVVHRLVAERGGVWFGAAVANAGDGSGDGIDDVLVGGNYGTAPGLVSLFDGRTGRLLKTFHEEDPTTNFGSSIAGLRDVDGDGLADIAIGAPGLGAGNTGPGRVHVLSSRTGKMIYAQSGERTGDAFGTTLCPLPDWRGPDEAAIAASARRGGPAGSGYVRVFRASEGTPLQTFASTNVASFGYSMVDLGDRDGDGYRDLGVASIQPGGVQIASMSYADYLRSQGGK